MHTHLVDASSRRRIVGKNREPCEKQDRHLGGTALASPRPIGDFMVEDESRLIAGRIRVIPALGSTVIPSRRRSSNGCANTHRYAGTHISSVIDAACVHAAHADSTRMDASDVSTTHASSTSR